MDYSLPGSLVLGISQARVLEWVATPSPGDLPDPGSKPRSPALQAVSCILYQLRHQGSICDTYFTSELLEQEPYPLLSTDHFFFFFFKELLKRSLMKETQNVWDFLWKHPQSTSTAPGHSPSDNGSGTKTKVVIRTERSSAGPECWLLLLGRSPLTLVLHCSCTPGLPPISLRSTLMAFSTTSEVISCTFHT